jgi:hypothetical protein
LFYLVHYLLFRDAFQVAIYGRSATLCFYPSKCCVVVIVEDVISNHEKQSKLNKLNLVIGAYFSEVGTARLEAFSTVDPHVSRIRSKLIVKGTWTGRDFLEARERACSSYLIATTNIWPPIQKSIQRSSSSGSSTWTC